MESRADLESGTGTESGYHFIQDYKTCKRYWKHKYKDALEPLKKQPPLIFGGAVHAAFASWYTLLRDGSTVKQRYEASIATFTEFMNAFKGDYEEREKYSDDLSRGFRLFEEYAAHYPIENIEVLAVEEYLEALLPSGDRLTGQADLVYRMLPLGKIVLRDHKTTGWSMSNYSRAQQASDQGTAYKLLWDQSHPDTPIQNIEYNICRVTKKEVEFRQIAMMKTHQDVREYELDTADEFRDLARRLSDENARWPKDTGACFLYNRPCVFIELCKGSNFDSLMGIKFKRRE